MTNTLFPENMRWPGNRTLLDGHFRRGCGSTCTGCTGCWTRLCLRRCLTSPSTHRYGVGCRQYGVIDLNFHRIYNLCKNIYNEEVAFTCVPIRCLKQNIRYMKIRLLLFRQLVVYCLRLY